MRSCLKKFQQNGTRWSKNKPFKLVYGVDFIEYHPKGGG